MEHLTEEAGHQGSYDTELITIKQTRDSKMEESDELTAKSEKLIADIQQLGEEIAALDVVMAKITEQEDRKEETPSAFTN